MLFEMSTETLNLIIQSEHSIQRKLGHTLNFSSENLVSDFFELVAQSKDRRLALQADQIWARMIKENADFDKRKHLNQYRSRMKDAMLRQEEIAA